MRPKDPWWKVICWALVMLCVALLFTPIAALLVWIVVYFCRVGIEAAGVVRSENRRISETSAVFAASVRLLNSRGFLVLPVDLPAEGDEVLQDLESKGYSLPAVRLAMMDIGLGSVINTWDGGEPYPHPMELDDAASQLSTPIEVTALEEDLIRAAMLNVLDAQRYSLTEPRREPRPPKHPLKPTERPPQSAKRTNTSQPRLTDTQDPDDFASIVGLLNNLGCFVVPYRSLMAFNDIVRHVVLDSPPGPKERSFAGARRSGGRSRVVALVTLMAVGVPSLKVDFEHGCDYEFWEKDFEATGRGLAEASYGLDRTGVEAVWNQRRPAPKAAPGVGAADAPQHYSVFVRARWPAPDNTTLRYETREVATLTVPDSAREGVMLRNATHLVSALGYEPHEASSAKRDGDGRIVVHVRPWD